MANDDQTDCASHDLPLFTHVDFAFISGRLHKPSARPTDQQAWLRDAIKPVKYEIGGGVPELDRPNSILGALLSRFWSKTKLGYNGCVLWTADISVGGYGRFQIDNKLCQSHRISYEMVYGPIPEGLIVMHTCDVRACVNPAHLCLGTTDDNNRDMFAKGRSPRPAGFAQWVSEKKQARTHCIRGHLLSGENVIVRKRKGKRTWTERVCVTCSKKTKQSSRMRMKAKKATVDVLAGEGENARR